ncbi:hypothetical protein FACS189497_08910 [Betaproteobacteria bacterium]|nr:hypothetical protein FACS189488_10340 [Betaproteobacteria bacterium]GHU29963.1 hypothetical protein FACS189497_08910 [Betaproteobacteria bacterium]
MTAPSPAIAGKSFEDLKQTNEYGAEYWSARTLQPLLGYSQWRRFEQAIERAVSSCKQSGNPPEHHFAGAGKMVDLGSGSVRDVDDYHLSRFACYLIAQNGDPRKPEIAHAQKYFANHKLSRPTNRSGGKCATPSDSQVLALRRARNIVSAVKQYERVGMSVPAETEVKKLFRL